jgi:putative RecB family exonuclease
MTCPLLYRFRVVDKLPSPPTAATARGTLVHAVLERLFDLPAGERTLPAAVALLPEEWERLAAEEPAMLHLLADGAGGEHEWFTQAGALLETWFGLEDPTRLEPAERELYVETDLDGLVLRGYVDRLDVAPDGAMRVVDYKTGRSPSERFESKALFQMKFYALVLWRLRGEIPRLLQLVYLGNGEIMRYEPDEQDLRGVERKVKALWAAIERSARLGDWRPSPSRLCDWCEHRSLCPAWGGTPPPLPDDAAVRAVDPASSGRVSRSESAAD